MILRRVGGYWTDLAMLDVNEGIWYSCSHQRDVGSLDSGVVVSWGEGK
jgi:hypothetical protein